MNSTGTTYANNRISFSLGQTEVEGEPTYLNRIIITSVAGAGNFAALTTRIEDVRTLANKKAKEEIENCLF